MSRIWVKTGVEGPKHDPYSFSELTVYRTSPYFTGTATFHQGLGEWVKVKEEGKLPKIFKEDQFTWFELYAGVTCRSAKRAYGRYHERRITRHACGVSAIEEVDGMPGETFTICRTCGTVLDTAFNLEAVR